MLPTRIGCPDCGTYGAIGPAHPSVDLGGWPGAEALTEPSAASWRQFRELAERLAPAVGPGVHLVPGAEFGPFTGVFHGGPADLVFGPVHLLFATPAAVARLADSEVALPPAVPSHLRRRGRAPVELLEFDVPCGGRLASEGFALRALSPCATCGRWDRTLERVVLEEGSAPEGADLVRPVSHPTVVLASERFVAAVHAAELTGIAFERADIAAPDT